MRGSVRRTAEVAIGMALALVGAPPVPAAAKPVPPVVTAAVQVSQDPNPARAHAMAQITRNPKTGTLIVADSDARIRRTVDVYRSTEPALRRGAPARRAGPRPRRTPSARRGRRTDLDGRRHAS